MICLQKSNTFQSCRNPFWNENQIDLPHIIPTLDTALFLPVLMNQQYHDDANVITDPQLRYGKTWIPMMNPIVVTTLDTKPIMRTVKSENPIKKWNITAFESIGSWTFKERFRWWRTKNICSIKCSSALIVLSSLKYRQYRWTIFQLYCPKKIHRGNMNNSYFFNKEDLCIWRFLINNM